MCFDWPILEFDMQNVFSVLIFFQIVVYGQFSSTVIQKVLDL